MRSMKNFSLGRRALVAGMVLLAGLISAGCTKSMQPGDLSRIQPLSDQPRAGNVYLLRGFIGIWSSGIDNIGQEINQSGVRANVYRCEQWQEVTAAILAKYKDQKVSEPLVIVGHSWGADHALDLARELEAAHIPIDLIVTLDPVTPPPVPGNVKWCYNIYQSHGAWDKIPFFRGVALNSGEGSRGLLQNLNIRTDRTDLLEPDTDHYNIEKNQKIHREIIKQIMKACPPREEWARLHPSMSPSMSPSGAPLAARARMAGAATTAPSTAPAAQDSHGGSKVSVLKPDVAAGP